MILLATANYTTGLPQVDASNVQVRQILQVIFAIFGALAVLMLVISGLRYVASQGSPQEVAKAKGTAVYALVGLVLAIMAESIVTFVLARLM